MIKDISNFHVIQCDNCASYNLFINNLNIILDDFDFEFAIRMKCKDCAESHPYTFFSMKSNGKYILCNNFCQQLKVEFEGKQLYFAGVHFGDKSINILLDDNENGFLVEVKQNNINIVYKFSNCFGLYKIMKPYYLRNKEDIKQAAEKFIKLNRGRT